jgi:hypothetical protein
LRHAPTAPRGREGETYQAGQEGLQVSQKSRVTRFDECQNQSSQANTSENMACQGGGPASRPHRRQASQARQTQASRCPATSADRLPGQPDGKPASQARHARTSSHEGAKLSRAASRQADHTSEAGQRTQVSMCPSEAADLTSGPASWQACQEQAQ